MRLGIVATVLDSSHLTGVEKYAFEFLKHTPEFTCGHEIVVFCHPGGQELVKSLNLPGKILVSPFSNRILTDQVWLPWQVREQKIDLVYNASLSYPWVGYGNRPFSVMVHDATPWRFPQTLSKGMKYYYRTQIELSLRSRNLKQIITNSQSSKGDIVQFCGVNEGLVYPVHLGVDLDWFCFTPNEEVLRNCVGEVADYVLTVGTIEPRKNLELAIKAFAMIADSFPNLNMIVVGRQGWQAALKIQEKLAQRIKFTGYVSDAELVALYSGAKVFIFPSIYEGFGFPMVEAMSCKTPVIASRTSSLPEVGGEACIYADPLSAEDFAEKLATLLRDKGLREKLAVQGFQQSRRYRWQETASQTWQILLNK